MSAWRVIVPFPRRAQRGVLSFVLFCFVFGGKTAVEPWLFCLFVEKQMEMELVNEVGGVDPYCLNGREW